MIVVTDPNLVSREVDLQNDTVSSPGRVLRDWDDRMARRRQKSESLLPNKASETLGSDLEDSQIDKDAIYEQVSQSKIKPDEPDFSELIQNVNSTKPDEDFKLDMSHIMSVFGVQYSKSYRKSAVPPPPPPVEDAPPDDPKTKKKSRKKKKVTPPQSTTPSAVSEKGSNSAKEKSKKQDAKSKDLKSSSAQSKDPSAQSKPLKSNSQPKEPKNSSARSKELSNSSAKSKDSNAQPGDKSRKTNKGN